MRVLAEWAGGPATVRLFERGRHNSILSENEEAYFDAIADFLEVVRGRGGARGTPGAR